MRRWIVGIGVLVLSVALLACGGGDGDDGGTSDDRGGDGRDGADATVEAVDTDELSYLTVNPVGLYRIEAESGDEHEVVRWADLDLPFGEAMQLARLHEGLVWGSLGPGHLVALDPDSGDVEVDLEFGSTQVVTDFGFAGGLVWVQAGFAYADAILLGVDRNSGDLVFTVEPPAGTTIGGIAPTDDGVWLIGGDPETTGAVSRVDPGSGVVSGTFDAGVVARYLSVGLGGVWVGGQQFQFEGKEGSAVVRLDPDTGEVLATIEIGETLRAILPYNGAIWVVDASGPDYSGAQLHRVDPATNAITDTIDIGEGGNGTLNLVAGDGYIFAMNSADRLTYVINAETVEGEAVVTGPTFPVAIP